ncbi:DUF998 domain-containing protein [Streptosporangium longisporum]|uniref:DUF998 domain-containing protein n=1 Tax=Streptosporangium longisporum TaxID=46187 RepID=A0ABN3XWE0_9ACTN
MSVSSRSGARTAATGRRAERRLLVCAALAPPLFILAFLVEGATRGAGYDPLRHPVSALALGEYGWTQRANFVLCGLLLLAGIAGLRTALRRRGAGAWAPLLLAMAAVGLVGAGIFAADPLSGYPLGTAPVPSPATATGTWHSLFSTPVFTALPAACCVLARHFATAGRRGWAAYSLATAAVALTCFVLASVAFDQNATLVPYGGLFQRLTIAVSLLWITAVSVDLLRRRDHQRGS